MHPEVEKIRAKMATSPWPKMLDSVTLSGFRGWNGEEVRFTFPVSVIVGANGSGKSTVLKAAAAAYTNALPRSTSFNASSFFPDTAWESVGKASITCMIREGSRLRLVSIRKPNERWRNPSSGRPQRAVVWQDISRTLPIESIVGYSRIAKRNAKEVAANEIAPEFTGKMAAILGQPYDASWFGRTDADEKRFVGVVQRGPLRYSQFHQGAGEGATLDLISLLQNVPDTSLVIVDEVEASLHPGAQRRLVHFLLWLARARHCQVLLSSHSAHVVDEIPPDGRILLRRSSDGVGVHYGVSSNLALNTMDEKDHPDLIVFCEDSVACVLAIELLRYRGVDIGRLRLIGAGPQDVVKTLGRVAAAGNLPWRSLGVVDGEFAAERGCLKLPGSQAPERQVVTDILNGSCLTLSQRLEMGEASIRDALTQVTSRGDHHEWVPHAARRLGQAEDYLWTTMCQVWVRHCLSAEEVDAFCNPIKAKLDGSA